MVTGVHTVFSCATNFLNGRKCVFCGSFKTVKTTRGYVKCMRCGKQKSLTKLRPEIAILQGFYQQQPAYRLASDLGVVDAKTVTRVSLAVVLPSSSGCVSPLCHGNRLSGTRDNRT